MDGRYKLVVNLLDSDEFYDLQEDPYELKNLINAPAVKADRDRMHQALLDQMQRTRDPLRSSGWAFRPWSDHTDPYGQFK